MDSELKELLRGPADASLLLLALATTTSNELQTKIQDKHLRAIATSALLRQTQTIQAILLLGKHLFVEEMWGLSRSLTELAINVCYLQTADPAEVQRYLHYDSITDSEWHKGITGIDGIRERLDNIPSHRETATRLSLIADKLREQRIYDGIKKGVWSKYNLDQRAVIIDRKHSKLPLFALIYRSIVKYADSFVHASPKAVAFYAEWVDNGRPRRDKPRKHDAASAMSLSTTVFLAMVRHLRFCYQLDENPLEEQIQASLAKEMSKDEHGEAI